MNIRWKKIPRFQKWSAHLEGKHVGTILSPGPNVWRCWVDAGEGMQEVNNFSSVVCGGSVAFAKANCVIALLELTRANNAATIGMEM